MFAYGVPSLRPKCKPTPVSKVCEAEPIRTQRITANAFRISLIDKSTTGFLTGQSWRVFGWGPRTRILALFRRRTEPEV